MFEQSSRSSTPHTPSFQSHQPHAQREQLPGAREARIILGGAFFAWLCLALLTFRSTDPSLFHVMVPAHGVANWCGSLGAHCAAFLYVLFGPAAWGVLLFSVFVLPRPDVTRLHIFARSLAAFTAMVSVGALLSVANIALVGPVTGGLFGGAALGISYWIGTAGCVITYTVTALFSLLFFAHISLNTVADSVQKTAILVGTHTWAALCWTARWIWAGSARLWQRAEAQEKEKNTNTATSFNFGGGSGDSGSDIDAWKPQEQIEESSDYSVPTFEINQTDEHADEVPRFEIEEPVAIHNGSDNDSFSSLMPEDNKENELTPDPDSSSLFNDVEIEEIAEASSDKSFISEVQPAQADDDLWHAESNGNGDTDVNDEPSQDDGPADKQESEQDYFGLDQDEEDDTDDEKVEIPDDGYDFSPAEQEVVEEQEVEEAPPAYEPPPVYTAPDASLFSPSQTVQSDDEVFMAACQERGRVLEEKLSHFGISGRVVGIHPGPVITLFEYEPDVGNKVSKIVALEDDLAMSLKALSIRIIAPVPGKCVVGFEIANEQRHSVLFGDVIANDGLISSSHQLPIALGSDIVGNPVIADLATMPHLLVAGATGAGKSVGMNVMLVSLLASMSPDKVRMILIDPKRLEFAPYADVPHLLFPIVTSPYEVAPVLKWVVQEMELRYEVMAQAGVRNIADYHKLDQADCFALEHNLGIRVKGMPYMVIMIDELADLMMVASKEIETLIARIAQMARAAGIHMIVATQRPSVDVVTGLIKANFPSRIAFRVSTKIDSRTIIDGPGAEKLLGKGDMLYLSPSNQGVQRLHGAYVTDNEVNRLTDYLKEQREVEYFSLRQVVAQHSEQKDEDTDPLYDEVCDYLKDVEEISISSLQRKYRVGFNRSARLIEMLERDGHIAPAQGSKPRRVLRD